MCVGGGGGGGGRGGGLTSDSKWGGHLFLRNSLKFPKKWGGGDLKPPSPLRGPCEWNNFIECVCFLLSASCSCISVALK